MSTILENLENPEINLIARQVLASRKRRKKSAPSMVDFAGAITDIDIADTMKGSSTLSLPIFDEGCALLDSGFFDADRDGKLDPIDLNYPAGSRYWWRLTQVALDDVGGADAELTMVFMERPAVYMMQHKGPVKSSRAKRTRAEFLAFLARHVKAGGGIHFVSKDLHKKQKTRKSEKTETERSVNKDGGIAKGAKIVITDWQGHDYKLKPDEIKNAEKVLDAAAEDTSAERPILALLEACIVEAPFFRNPKGGTGTSAGILQLLSSHGSLAFRRNIKNVVHLFLTKGFTGRGGAIDLAEKHKSWSPGQIAQAVQGSAFGERYEQVREGAQKVLDAYGGVSITGGTRRKNYNFQVGSQDNPHEDFWVGSNRLADEVKWAFFLDGNYLYFDPETTLIKQKPVAVIRRGDPGVVSVGDATWDNRQIATEVSITLICDPFEFRAGQVLQLEGFGPLSTGTTAKLPGRWLISETSGSRFSPSRVFTLVQPTKPAPEPAAQTISRKSQERGSEDVAPTGGWPLAKKGTFLQGPGGSGTHHRDGVWEDWNAVDLGVPKGTAVYAVADGTIGPQFGLLPGGNNKGVGRFAGLRLHLVTHDNEWYYAHLSQIAGPVIRPGAKVKSGDLLGWSGVANGVAHLHLAVKNGNPLDLLGIEGKK